MKFLKTVFALALLSLPLQAQEESALLEMPVAGFKNEVSVEILQNNEILLKADSTDISASKIPETEKTLGSNTLELLKKDDIRAEIDSLQNLLKERSPDGELEYVPLEEFTYAGHRRYTIDGGRPLLKTNIKPIPTAIVGGLYTGLFIVLHQAQSVWWGDNATFKIIEDWDFALQADKAGHFFGGYLASYAMHESFLASGFSWETSVWAGGAMGLLYQSYVEAMDGYAKGWGFSFSDEYFNTLGAGFFVAQHYVPFLQNFQPKWQFIPADITGDRPRKNALVAGNFIDDYNSSTFWMSVNVNNMLSESVEQYWPDWLMLSVGYGARNIETGYDNERARRIMIGFDYNLVELLPDGPNWWNWVRQTVNHFKFPAPTLEFSRGITTFRILYPFQIRL